jgi:hypothetical protein
MLAAIDTGTTLIYVPTSVAKALYAKLGGTAVSGSAGEYHVPCVSTFGSIGLSFNGVAYNIPLDDIFLGYASASTTSECILGIFGQDMYDADGNSVAIVGNLFLKSVYSVFSYSQNGSPAVGFAPSVTSGLSSSSSSSSSSTGSSSSSSSGSSVAGSASMGLAASSNSTGSSGSASSGSSTSAAVAGGYTATAVAVVTADAGVASSVQAYSAAPQVTSSASGSASGSSSDGSSDVNSDANVIGGFTFTIFSTAPVASSTSTPSSNSGSSSSGTTTDANGNIVSAAEQSAVPTASPTSGASQALKAFSLVGAALVAGVVAVVV